MKPPPVVRRERPELLPLSYGQRYLWLSHGMHSGSTQWNVPLVVRLHGRLDVESLRNALTTIVERHESLRTRFPVRAETPYQSIAPAAPVELPVDDLGGLTGEARRQRVAATLEEEVFRPFDLATGPIVRFRLLRLDELEHVLCRTIHHIASDAWSTEIFKRELFVLYDAFRQGRPNPLAPLPIQYADYTLWQLDCLDAGRMRIGLEYWRPRLSGIPDRLTLLPDQSRPSKPTFRAQVHRLGLEPQRVKALARLGQSNRATLYMVLLSALGVLLSCHSGQSDVVVGSPIANRPVTELEALIGYFTKSIWLRMDVRREMSVGTLLEQVRRTTLDAYAHADTPILPVIEELSLTWDSRTTPIFQVLFALQNVPKKPTALSDLQADAEVLSDSIPLVRYDLEVHALEHGESVEMYWMYKRDVFSASFVERLASAYARILDEMLENQQKTVESISGAIMPRSPSHAEQAAFFSAHR